MNKNIKTVLLVVIVIAVLLFAAFAPTKKAFKSISFEDYSSLEKPSVVYIGDSNEVLKVLKDIDINKKYSVLYLDY